MHFDALPCSRCESEFMMQRDTTGSANNVVSMYTNTIFIFECRKLQEMQEPCIGKSELQSGFVLLSQKCRNHAAGYRHCN